MILIADPACCHSQTAAPKKTLSGNAVELCLAVMAIFHKNRTRI